MAASPAEAAGDGAGGASVEGDRAERMRDGAMDPTEAPRVAHTVVADTHARSGAVGGARGIDRGALDSKGCEEEAGPGFSLSDSGAGQVSIGVAARAGSATSGAMRERSGSADAPAVLPRAVGGGATRTLFRVLRPGEASAGSILSPAMPFPPMSAPSVDDVREHVVNGSAPGYESRFLSTTAELRVAMAFAGCLSRVACIQPAMLEPGYVFPLDKEYLREHLNDDIAELRSKRADEVLIGCEVPSAAYELLEVRVVPHSVTRTPCQETDGDRFPEPQQLVDLLRGGSTERLSGANKRLFRVSSSDGRSWIARPPRPNCREDRVLVGGELVAFAKHEFTCFSAYRALSHDVDAPLVPRCALYELKLEYSGLSSPGAVMDWALLLLEDFDWVPRSTEGWESELQRAAQQLVVCDALLGNWACTGGVKNFTDLCSEGEAVYAVSRADRRWVRIAVDRSLGCTLPEDLSKRRRVKRLSQFVRDNTLLLLESLIKQNPWLYGAMEERDVLCHVIDLELVQRRTGLVKAVPDKCPWPDLGPVGREYQADQREFSLHAVLEYRVQSLLNFLPFQLLPVQSPSPCARDGHGAVAMTVTSTDVVFIIGGNSKKGACRDCWKFTRATETWAEMASVPGLGRYSMSTAVLKERYIACFGGCRTTHHKQGFLDDLVVYDTYADTWTTVAKQTSKPWPPKRCRHVAVALDGSAISAGGAGGAGRGTADTLRMYVIGGFGGSRGRSGEALDDVWEGTLYNVDGTWEVTWREFASLRHASHRHFAFVDAGRNIVVVGGSGTPYHALQVIPTGRHEEAPVETIMAYTRDAQNVSATGRLDQTERLKGFAAIYDPLEKSCFVFGGATPRGDRDRSSGGARSRKGTFGSFEDRSTPSRRMLALSRAPDSLGRMASSWSVVEPHQYLDDVRGLPIWQSRSASLLSTGEVLLFGGRKGNQFSNQLHAVHLRRQHEKEIREIRASAADLERQISGSEFPDHARAAALRELSVPLQRGAPTREISLLVFNVHGWSNADRTRLTDSNVAAVVESEAPDVVCLQEVKHPFPTSPEDGHRVVRVGTRAQLLRYSDDEGDAAITERLRSIGWRGSVPDAVQRFASDVSARRNARYMHGVLKTDGGGVRDSGETKSVDTALHAIARSMGSNDPLFCAAKDETFGNAILSRSSQRRGSAPISSGGEETRCACFVDVEHDHNWPMVIASVHLDANAEDIRLQQVRALLRRVYEYAYSDRHDRSKSDVDDGDILVACRALPHVLCGDFNALSSWTDAHSRARAAASLEPARDDVYRFLTEEAGYIDMESSCPPRATCEHGTRVDYVFCSPALHARLSWARLSVLEQSFSDHRPLKVQMRIASKRYLIGVLPSDTTDVAKVVRQVQQESRRSVCVMQVPDDATDTHNQWMQAFEHMSRNDVVVVIAREAAHPVLSLDALLADGSGADTPLPAGVARGRFTDETDLAPVLRRWLL